MARLRYKGTELRHTGIGSFEPGQVREIPDHEAERWAARLPELFEIVQPSEAGAETGAEATEGSKAMDAPPRSKPVRKRTK